MRDVFLGRRSSEESRKRDGEKKNDSDRKIGVGRRREKREKKKKNKTIRFAFTARDFHAGAASVTGSNRIVEFFSFFLFVLSVSTISRLGITGKRV